MESELFLEWIDHSHCGRWRLPAVWDHLFNSQVLQSQLLPLVRGKWLHNQLTNAPYLVMLLGSIKSFRQTVYFLRNDFPIDVRSPRGWDVHDSKLGHLKISVMDVSHSDHEGWKVGSWHTHLHTHTHAHTHTHTQWCQWVWTKFSENARKPKFDSRHFTRRVHVHHI